MKRWSWVMAGTLSLVTGSALAASNVSSKPQCQAGKIQCVHHVIQEMDARFRKLASRCDHDAIFSLVYLRTTEKYGETALHLGYGDVSSVTREDSQFADYYFRAYDAYHSGCGNVPPAWKIAFDAAEARILPAQGDALLGINAHIQRDLAFTLYDLYRQGHPVSYDDHNLVNVFLAQVDVADEIVRRFDPTYPTGGDSSLIFYWRELAWQNYMALRNAPDQATFDAVAGQIELGAALAAQAFVQATAYPPGSDSSARDAYCAASP
jgi:hypothetical protein